MFSPYQHSDFVLQFSDTIDYLAFIFCISKSEKHHTSWAQIKVLIKITIATEYKNIPPMIKKTAKFLLTVAVARFFIWYIKSGQV